MAALFPFRALRPVPAAAASGGGALRRRQHGRSARAGARQSRSASCTSRAPRSICRPAPIRTATRSTNARARTSPRCGATAPLVVEDDAEPLRLPPADGRARADRRRRLLLAATSTSATSSRSTSGRGGTRKTTARGTSLELRAQTGPVFLTYRASAGDRRRRAAARPRPRRSSTSPPPTACSTRVWRRRAGATPARWSLRSRRCRALHRRRPSSRGQRGPRAAATRGGRRGAGRVGHVPGRGVSRRPDAGAALQPRRQGSGRPHAGAVAGSAARAVHRDGRSGHADAQRRGGDVSRGAWHTLALGDGAGGRSPPASRLDVSRLQDAGPDAAARHRRRAHRQAHRLRRRRPRHRRARAARARPASAAVAFSLYPGQRRRPDGDLGRRRHHAAQVHLVRAQASRRLALALI